MRALPALCLASSLLLTGCSSFDDGPNTPPGASLETPEGAYQQFANAVRDRDSDAFATVVRTDYWTDLHTNDYRAIDEYFEELAEAEDHDVLILPDKPDAILSARDLGVELEEVDQDAEDVAAVLLEDSIRECSNEDANPLSPDNCEVVNDNAGLTIILTKKDGAWAVFGTEGTF